MKRLTHSAEAISCAYAAVGPFAERLRCDIYTADPIWTGLHHIEHTLDGRSYSQTAHFLPERLASDHRATICLPEPAPWYLIVHELGHVLDERLDYEIAVAPVTDYARRNRREAFAEAFLSYCVGHEGQPPFWQVIHERLDPRFIALMNGLL